MPFYLCMTRFVFIAIILVFFTRSLYSNEPSHSVDKILMKIGGETVYLSEFETLYSDIRKNKDCSVEEYFHYFLKYKLKIFDAKRQGLDKSAEYTDECERLKHCLHAKDGMSVNKVRVLTYKVRQDEGLSYAFKVMKEVYDNLQTGADWNDVCSCIKDPRFSCRVEHDMSSLLTEERMELDKIHGSGFSEPFVSPVGVNILLKSDDENCSVELLGNADDAILVSLWNEHHSEDLYSWSEADLQEFFRTNRKKYLWELPHYKGGVIHCKNKKAARKIKKKLKKLPMDCWEGKLSELKEKDVTYDAMVETGLFQIGENVYVDKLVFKCGDYKPKGNYPYAFVLGKCLDYMPDSYSDVYDVLVQDYIQKHEELYFENLEREFRVEKYIDVLKTVNSDGSN